MINFITAKDLEKIAEISCCLNCDTPLNSGGLRMYDLPEDNHGYRFEGRENKVWIYFECDKCKYGNSLWKLLKRFQAR